MTIPQVSGYGNYLYPYQAYSPPQFNNWNNYGYSTPVFRGAEYQPTVQQPLKQDTVQISAEKEIKTNKKEGLSAGARWAIGIAGTVALGIAAHKFIPPMRMQNRVQRIFLENFSKEEAKAIQKKYNDILKIQDKDEFIDKLFKELKKDYKLDNIPIRLDKTFKAGEKSGEIVAGAHFMPHHEKGFLEIGVDKTHSNESLLKSLTHEFRHAKQDLYNYQTSLDKKELISIYEKRIRNTLTPEDLKKLDDVPKEAEILAEELEKFYHKLGINRIDKTNPNWAWGRKSLDSFKTYANKSQEAYNTAFYETDAKATGNLMMRFTKGTLF